MMESAECRSRVMRAVRARDTRPELVVRRCLHGAGLRYRLYAKGLPGRPDLVFPARRLALFVHGCFWHQHEGCKAARRPRSRLEYWDAKLDRNRARDARVIAELEALGWRVCVFWECQTRDRAALGALIQDIVAIPPRSRYRSHRALV